MKPSEVTPGDTAPQRVLVTSREELHEAVLIALRGGRRTVRALHHDLSAFDLSSSAAADALLQLLLAHRTARIRMLVDDASWLDTRAARLRLLQRRFPHALELRLASDGDPVGEDAWLLVDDHASLELRPSRNTSGSLWLHHRPYAQPLLSAFDRRWEVAGHNLPTSPLGLG